MHAARALRAAARRLSRPAAAPYGSQDYHSETAKGKPVRVAHRRPTQRVEPFAWGIRRWRRPRTGARMPRTLAAVDKDLRSGFGRPRRRSVESRIAPLLGHFPSRLWSNGVKMTRTRPLFLLAVSLLILAGCNMPLPGTAQEPTSASLRGQVSVPTEFRAGPGDGYDLLGMLLPGQEVDVVGLSSEGEYLLIQDPADPTVIGWLKAEAATLSGNPIGLPVPTPPSTPTPVDLPPEPGGCPTPVGGGPTPVSCEAIATLRRLSYSNRRRSHTSQLRRIPPSGGCPTPIGGGPTPVSCGASHPQAGALLRSAVVPHQSVAKHRHPPAAALPQSAADPHRSAAAHPHPPAVALLRSAADPPRSAAAQSPPSGGCPTPIGGGPTPVSCGASPPSGGCPTPIGGGPTPVSCFSGGLVPRRSSGCPTPIGGGPTPVSCPTQVLR